MENHEEEVEEREMAEEEGAEEEQVEGDDVTSLTLERVAAAKQFIESHYKAHMKHIQDRKERYIGIFYVSNNICILHVDYIYIIHLILFFFV